MTGLPRSTLQFAELPEGTVTFLVTDIEGSTQLLAWLCDRYARLQTDHRRILREIFARWNGQELETQRDAFLVAFPRATDGVHAAVDGQRALAAHDWPEGSELRVRMGLHTGEPYRAEEGYMGIDIHRAARIDGQLTLCRQGAGVRLPSAGQADQGAPQAPGLTIGTADLHADVS